MYGSLDVHSEPMECYIPPQEARPSYPLRPWQTAVIDMLKTQGPRQVLWIYDPKGGQGKSYLSLRICADTPGALLVQGGRKMDIMYALQKKAETQTPTLLLMDLMRASTPGFISYTSIEAAQDGAICSTKYESTSVILDRPMKILVMANMLPDWTKMSLDRWDVHHLDDGVLSPVAPPEEAVPLVSGPIPILPCFEPWAGVPLPGSDGSRLNGVDGLLQDMDDLDI